MRGAEESETSRIAKIEDAVKCEMRRMKLAEGMAQQQEDSEVKHLVRSENVRRSCRKQRKEQARNEARMRSALEKRSKKKLRLNGGTGPRRKNTRMI